MNTQLPYSYYQNLPEITFKMRHWIFVFNFASVECSTRLKCVLMNKQSVEGSIKMRLVKWSLHPLEREYTLHRPRADRISCFVREGEGYEGYNL